MSAVGDARVRAVRVSGKSGAYAFEVTIASNDRGPHHSIRTAASAAPLALLEAGEFSRGRARNVDFV